MLKKILYILAAILFVLFVYFNYFKEESPLKFDLTDIIETRGVVYKSKDYKLRAETQIDDIEKKETFFKNAKAIFKNMSISSDSAFIDALKNLVLSGNIDGVGKNGWKISAKSASYSAEMEKLYSEEGVTAYNEEKKISIFGDRFESDKSMEDMVLSGNITVRTESLILKGEKAHYSDSTDMLDMDGGIEFSVVSKDGGAPITGRFDSLEYDGKKKIARGHGNLVADYDGMKMSGREFVYYENSGDFEVLENLKITGDGVDLGLKKIYYNNSKREMNLYGKIIGKSEGYKFSANSGVYYPDRKILKISDDVSVLGEKGDKLIAELVEYNTATGEAAFLAPSSGKVEYVSAKERLSSKNFNYNLKTKELFAANKYIYTGEKYTSTGDSMLYNTDTKKGLLKNAKIEDGKNRLSATETNVDFSQLKHTLKGKVSATYGDYMISSKSAVVDETTEKITFDSNFKIIQQKKKLEISGDSGYYSDRLKKAEVTKNAKVLNSEYFIQSKSAEYNLDNEEANFNGDIFAKDLNKGHELRAEEAIYKKDSFIKLTGNVEMKIDGYTISSKKADYDKRKELIYLPGEIEFSGSDIKGRMYEGYYDLQKKSFTGRNFYAVSQERELRGKNGHYSSEEKILKLSGDVTVKDAEMEAMSQGITYYIPTSYAVSEKDVSIKYGGINLDSKWAKVNMDTDTAEGGDVTFRDNYGESVSGDGYLADFKNNAMEVAGDVSGVLLTKGGKDLKFSLGEEKLYFKSDLLRLLLRKNGGSYSVYKSELRNNVELNYGDYRIFTQKLELDHFSRESISNGNSRLQKSDGSEISSDKLRFNSNTKVAVAEGNVRMKSILKDSGEVHVSSDYAKYDDMNRQSEFIGNVVLDKGGTTMWSDEGYYDMQKEQVKGKGNVFVEHLSGVESDRKKEGKKRQIAVKNIQTAMDKVKIQSLIRNSVFNLNLPAFHGEVLIEWDSSDVKTIGKNGKVNHPGYLAGDSMIKLTGTFTLEGVSRKKDYYVKVEKEVKEKYLSRELSKFELGVYPEGAVAIELPKNISDIKLEWQSLGGFIDSNGKIVGKPKNGPVLKALFRLEDKRSQKIFSAVIKNRELRFVAE